MWVSATSWVSSRRDLYIHICMIQRIFYPSTTRRTFHCRHLEQGPHFTWTGLFDTYSYFLIMFSFFSVMHPFKEPDSWNAATFTRRVYFLYQLASLKHEIHLCVYIYKCLHLLVLDFIEIFNDVFLFVSVYTHTQQNWFFMFRERERKTRDGSLNLCSVCSLWLYCVLMQYTIFCSH